MKKTSKFLHNILSKYWQGAESHSSNPHNPYSKLIKTQFQNPYFISIKNNINYSAESHSSKPISKPISTSTSTNK